MFIRFIKEVRMHKYFSILGVFLFILISFPTSAYALTDAEAIEQCTHEFQYSLDIPNYLNCKRCLIDGKVWTELGCITPTQEGITIWVMMIVVGVVTGAAVFRFIQAGLMLNTEDKEKKKEAFGIAGSAVAALVMVGLVTVYLELINMSLMDVIKKILGI